MRWVIDEDGDIGLSFWDILIFVKYKHQVMRRWFVWLPDAPKYVGKL
jgi:hypothetical protein